MDEDEVLVNGYGDYEMIDMIHRRLGTTEPHLYKWDHFFQWQAASRAVRNRKTYLIEHLRQIEEKWPDRDAIQVLNLGSGPCRDLFEYLTQTRQSKIRFHCLDSDPNAIRYAEALCSEHLERITFQQANALRFKPVGQYDFIWSGGLFDYL